MFNIGIKWFYVGGIPTVPIPGSSNYTREYPINLLTDSTYAEIEEEEENNANSTKPEMSLVGIYGE